MLGEFSGKEKSHGSLDLSGGQSGLLAVARQTRSLKSQALEDIVDEGVQDGHASLGDTSVGVDLLQHLVDVQPKGLRPLLAPRLQHRLQQAHPEVGVTVRGGDDRLADEQRRRRRRLHGCL